MDIAAQRPRAILAGLYLSRFDRQALAALGFGGPREAFNVIGYALGVRPASIKNYRDEFDPYFSNPRAGWKGRPLRGYCRAVMEQHAAWTFDQMTEAVKGMLIEQYEVEQFLASLSPAAAQEDAVAKRLATGKAAEAYFRQHYGESELLAGYDLTDTTLLGCGFDFRLVRGSAYYCVEVKGLQGPGGSIVLTEKEHQMAERLRERYVLYVVSHFSQRPVARLFVDPLASALRFVRQEAQLVQVSFSAYISGA